MNIKNAGIGIRLWSGFGAVLGLFAAAIIIVTLSLNVVVKVSKQTADESLPYAMLSEKMAFDIVQVQQFLTDVSATHNADGYKDAEEAAKDFGEGIGKFKEFFKKGNDSKGLRSIEELESDFDKYYTLGKRMAGVYVSQGVDAGNKIMEDFDKVSLGLATKMREFRKIQVDGATLNAHKAIEAAGGTRMSLYILGILILIVGLLFSYYITRSITHPVSALKEVMAKIALGDFRADITIFRRDEIGELAGDVRKTVTSLSRMIDEVLTMGNGVVHAVDVLKSKADETASGARDQSDQASRIAAAAEEMSQTITDIARNASVASETSGEAMQIAEIGKEVADGAVTTVNKVYTSTVELAAMVEKLNKRASEIGDIVTVIKDIADQTNLLALNAAIEAARAGEQGRGFAVVADEVRKLAERTIKATTEISGKIGAVQEESKQTSKSMDEASEEVTKATTYIREVGDSLHHIVESVQKVRDQITQIATAVEEQSATSEEVARNIEKTSEIAQKMERMSEETMHEANGLGEIAGNLRTAASGFKTRVHFE